MNRFKIENKTMSTLKKNDTVRVVGDKTKGLYKVVGFFSDDVEKVGTDYVGKVKLRPFGFSMRPGEYSHYSSLNKLKKVTKNSK